MKQKVIALLEPYRDKELSFGCEIESLLGGEGLFKVTGFTPRGNICTTIREKSDGMPRHIELDDEEYKIIGHPLTLCELLRALKEIKEKESGHNYNILHWFSEQGIDIPLNHRHIEDIPDDDAMWKQLLTILKS